jgi:hypothetical protein
MSIYTSDAIVGQNFEFVEFIGAMLRSFSQLALIAREDQ